jgi:2'-5' RNA ligase
MRLFIAINFTDDIKNNLGNVIGNLKENTLQRRMTRRENLHLTLVFLGEIEPGKIAEIKKIMAKIDVKRFILKLSGFGWFKRNSGSICWVGVEKNSALTELYQQLCDGLLKSGFDIEQREYKPHITLSRDTVLKENFDKQEFIKTIPNMKMTVDRISLMKSEQIKGKLTYTEIYSVELKK